MGQGHSERAAADARGHDDSFCSSYKHSEKKIKVYLAELWPQNTQQGSE